MPRYFRVAVYEPNGFGTGEIIKLTGKIFTPPDGQSFATFEDSFGNSRLVYFRNLREWL